jgi:hypothetical protein
VLLSSGATPGRSRHPGHIQDGLEAPKRADLFHSAHPSRLTRTNARFHAPVVACRAMLIQEKIRPPECYERAGGRYRPLIQFTARYGNQGAFSADYAGPPVCGAHVGDAAGVGVGWVYPTSVPETAILRRHDEGSAQDDIRPWGPFPGTPPCRTALTGTPSPPSMAGAGRLSTTRRQEGRRSPMPRRAIQLSAAHAGCSPLNAACIPTS